jgi:signal transduction histidine kinase
LAWWRSGRPGADDPSGRRLPGAGPEFSQQKGRSARKRAHRRDGANGSSELLAVAQARQRHFQQSLDAHRSLLFEDDVRLDPAFRWLCLPIMEENSPHLVVLGTTDDRSETSSRVEAASSAEFVRLLHDELRAPLASMVAMAATLSSKTTDDISARAKLINQTGRQILRRLNALLRLSEGEDVTNEH